jgi:hypothetical protein
MIQPFPASAAAVFRISRGTSDAQIAARVAGAGDGVAGETACQNERPSVFILFQLYASSAPQFRHAT